MAILAVIVIVFIPLSLSSTSIIKLPPLLLNQYRPLSQYISIRR